MPILAVPDKDDAQAVFDALNAAYSTETDMTKRQRLALLLIAAHAELTRTDTTEEN